MLERQWPAYAAMPLLRRLPLRCWHIARRTNTELPKAAPQCWQWRTKRFAHLMFRQGCVLAFPVLVRFSRSQSTHSQRIETLPRLSETILKVGVLTPEFLQWSILRRFVRTDSCYNLGSPKSAGIWNSLTYLSTDLEVCVAKTKQRLTELERCWEIPGKTFCSRDCKFWDFVYCKLISILGGAKMVFIVDWY